MQAWTEKYFESKDSAIGRDLKLNFKKLTESASLNPEEASLTVLALAKTVGFHELQEAARTQALELGVAKEKVLEAEESAALMGMLNTYYKFRHMVTNGQAEKAEAYGVAGLRMQSMANPALGKPVFEMLAFAVSVVNGCEKCIQAHEKQLIQHGYTTDKIHDLARLASVIKGISAL